MKILAIDIGGTKIKSCISNLNGDIEFFNERDSEAKKGAKYLMENVINIINEYDNYDSIGVSTAGQVDNVTGEIIFANKNIPGYTGTKVKNILEEKFNVPVKVENDVNAAALGEKHFGIARNYNDFLCLTYGTGIGGAIVIDNDIYRGYEKKAAEFGHIMTHPLENEIKYYEDYASTIALVNMAKEISEEYTDGKIIFDKFKANYTIIVDIVKKWIDEICIGLVSLIHIFNPPVIILGGGVMEQDIVIEMIKKRIKKLTLGSFSDIKIEKASLGNKAGLLGAVSLYK